LDASHSNMRDSKNLNKYCKFFRNDKDILRETLPAVGSTAIHLHI
jgi:hypothetical protein